MTKGKVVLVPFPFDDLTATKVRPAVCLTEPIGIHRHVILGFVSSQPPQNLEATDILLHPRHTDFGRTGLRVASVLRRKAGAGIQFNDHCDDLPADVVFRHACKLGFEGILSKRLALATVPAAPPDWLKMKNPASAAVIRYWPIGTNGAL